MKKNDNNTYLIERFDESKRRKTGCVNFACEIDARFVIGIKESETAKCDESNFCVDKKLI